MASERSGQYDSAGLEVLLGQLQDAVVFVDPTGRVLLTNREQELVVPGASELADLGDPFQIFRPDGRPYKPPEWPVLRSVTSGEVVVDEEFFRLAPDGGRRSFSCRSAPIYSNGSIVAAVLVTRDVTDSVLTQAALGEANSRTEAILETITGSFSALDAEWRYTYLNQRALERVQELEGKPITLGDLVGQTVWKAFPQLVGTTTDHELHRAVREQRTVTFETCSQTGEWLEVRIYPSKEGGLSVYGRDITERKRAEEQLSFHASLVANMEDAVVATGERGDVTAWNRSAERMFGWTAAEALGRNVGEVVRTGYSEAELADVLRELADTGRRHSVETRYHKDGTPVTTDSLTIAVRDDQGSLNGYLGIARDVTERPRYQLELEHRVHQQAVVARLGVKALENSDLEAVIDEAVALVRRTLEVEYVKVEQLLPGGERLLISAGAGWREGVVGASVIPAGRGSPAGYALMTGEPVIVDDVTAETRFAVPAVLREHDVMSDVTVVIDPRGNPFGALAALSKRRRSFSEDDVSFMQSVANVLATAVERSEEDKRLDAAREAERSRIARDLHDEALRELTDAFALATIGRSTTPQPDDERRWAGLITALQSVDQQLRSAIYDLRLGADEERPFADLLGDLVTIQADIDVDRNVQLYGREALPAGSLGHQGIEVLRILREAMINARRHSGATTIRVDAGGSSEDVLRLEVTDDGGWPDLASAVRNLVGTGIKGMLERADLLGADLQIESRRGGGTRVSVELPLGALGREEGNEERVGYTRGPK